MLADNEIHWDNGKAALPHNADCHVECVSFEVAVWLDMRVTGQCFFFNRLPPSPWAYTGVEVDERLFVCWRCAIGSCDASYQGNSEQYGEEIEYPCVGNSELHDDGCYYSGGHSPEIAFTIEAPPMPFQYVGRDVSSEECSYNPLEYFIDVFQEESDDSAVTTTATEII